MVCKMRCVMVSVFSCELFVVYCVMVCVMCCVLVCDVFNVFVCLACDLLCDVVWLACVCLWSLLFVCVRCLRFIV